MSLIVQFLELSKNVTDFNVTTLKIFTRNINLQMKVLKLNINIYKFYNIII